LESDLKASQGSLEELDARRRELEEGLKKRDQDIKALGAKVEEEQGQAANLSKKLKELQV
jgi:peptidoglycan hydrolase CwlO-like protein